MKKLFAVLALLAVSGIPTLAQARDGGEGAPLFEVNGGYTYMRWQVPDFERPPSSFNYNGFNAGAALHIFNWLALATDISGVYNTQGASGANATSHIYSYLAGPRIYPLGHHRLTPYVHGLVGLASYNLHVPASSGIPVFDETDNNLSFAVGGGVDWNWTKHISIRVAQLDYQQTRALRADAVALGGAAQNQNNFKYSGGVVIRFGER
jgi:opacity protein-like surface antigen